MIENYSVNAGRKNGDGIFSNSVTVRYGKDDVKKEFVRISEIEDDEKRNKEIDAFVKKMEKNSSKNSFFRRDERIPIGVGIIGKNIERPHFLMDDMELYYLFFKYYRAYKQKFPNYQFGKSFFGALKALEKDYFGEYNGSRKLRDDLLTPKLKNGDNNEEFYETTSIKDLYKRNCAMCVERASVAHNLWLLGGFESAFVSSAEIKFSGSNDNAHAFCLVNKGERYHLFDPARNFYKDLEEGRNPREEILSGKIFEIKDNNGEMQIYANYNQEEKVM